MIWDNQADTSKFNPIINPTSPFTDLSRYLEALKVENSEENVGSLEKIRSAAVLITDGGHNQEDLPANRQAFIRKKLAGLHCWFGQ